MSKFQLAALALAALLGSACGGGRSNDGGPSGTVSIDGSSTVFPISEAIAEEFMGEHPRVRVSVGQSGTGGGFKKFCNSETDISDASRPINSDEKALCAQKSIEPVELQVAIDGLSIVVNKANDFVKCMTVAELKKAWEPGSTVKTWKDINPQYPAQPIKFYAPGADSGTFDYFTEEVVGKADSLRQGPEVQTSEDDKILVNGVKGDRYSMGFFGYAYFKESRNDLKAV
ncbi:MAG TPA: PstS family phosphate ABC transporter substrate-binding protein, partial [Actinomycetota bacterium]|nr:PstS family phosphate ABC transporter substrate-binding protein [Actinomycetota bacterium]